MLSKKICSNCLSVFLLVECSVALLILSFHLKKRDKLVMPDGIKFLTGSLDTLLSSKYTALQSCRGTPLEIIHGLKPDFGRTRPCPHLHYTPVNSCAQLLNRLLQCCYFLQSWVFKLYWRIVFFYIHALLAFSRQ